MKINLFAIRHGEATHNVLFKKVGMSTFFDENYYDTELTDKGFNQAQELGNKWTDKNKMDLVIVPSEHTKQGFLNSVYDKINKGPDGKQQKVGDLKLEKPMENPCYHKIGSHLGYIWIPFGFHFGPTLGSIWVPLWSHFGSHLGPI